MEKYTTKGCRWEAFLCGIVWLVAARSAPRSFLSGQGYDKWAELWYNIHMDVRELPGGGGRENTQQSISGRLIGLQGRLARPFWGVMGLWAVLCGTLASNRLRWEGEELLSLALVLLLADLGWGSLWDLIAGTDWFHLMARGWCPDEPVAHPASWTALPYTQPDAPSGRFARGFTRLGGWWRGTFWPVAGPALLGALAAAVLTAVLSLLLPVRLRSLNAMLVALLGLGLVQRCRGRDALAGEALVLVGLCWLAGHMVLVDVEWPSLALALSFALAVWGGLRVARGLRGGLWLLNGGQAAGVALLAGLKQPLAAGVVGLLFFGQVALQPSLRYGGEPARVFHRAWPWLMAAMLVAALALP